ETRNQKPETRNQKPETRKGLLAGGSYTARPDGKDFFLLCENFTLAETAVQNSRSRQVFWFLVYFCLLPSAF
ncbi:MAG: hypothetical protein ABI837_17075, partial [Acidobacteriota bacterium]